MKIRRFNLEREHNPIAFVIGDVIKYSGDVYQNIKRTNKGIAIEHMRSPSYDLNIEWCCRFKCCGKRSITCK